MNNEYDPTPLFNLPRFEPGWVWLVGAGPGDPGLLTLHALNALQQADVIIYDALVGEQVLEHAKPSAIKEYAGKRGGKPSPSQRDISLRLIELARQDKRVCRLKGGDPFVFGRGGEEALALVEASAMKHLGSITDNLINAGRKPSEPMAIICNASLPQQSVLETTLGEAVRDAKAQQMEPPAMVVLGEVVRLRAALDWLGALQGRILEKDPLNSRSQSRAG